MSTLFYDLAYNITKSFKISHFQHKIVLEILQLQLSNWVVDHEQCVTIVRVGRFGWQAWLLPEHNPFISLGRQISHSSLGLDNSQIIKLAGWSGMLT